MITLKIYFTVFSVLFCALYVSNCATITVIIKCREQNEVRRDMCLGCFGNCCDCDCTPDVCILAERDNGLKQTESNNKRTK